MTEFAIIDIGSNSIRYGEERDSAIPEKEIYTTRLGAGLSRTGRLAEDTAEKSLEVLRSLGNRARAAGLIPCAYATSAVRDAENGREFAERVESECGIEVRILSGEQEARYAFIGALRGSTDADTMLDVGGASMQIVREDLAQSYPAGCVRCGDIARDAFRLPDCDTMWQMQRMVVDGYMDGLIELPHIDIKGLVGVGGTITTLAALKAGLTEFSREAVDAVTLTRRDVSVLINELAAMGEKRRSHPLLKERHDVILYGAYIVHHAMKLLKADSMSVSCSDGMEGFLKVMKSGNTAC